MQPRLKSSVKWTKLPQEITDQIRELFKQNFQNELQNSEVIVEGRIYKEEILLRVGYLEKGRLTQNNFEISMNYKLTQEESATKTLHVCVDAAGSLMAEYFEADEEVELPYTWTEFPFEGKKVWLQFSTTNSNLEKQANALLGEDDEALVQGEVDDSEDVGTDVDDEFSDDDADPDSDEEFDVEDDEDLDSDDDSDDDNDDAESEDDETDEDDESPRFKKPRKNKKSLH